MIQFLKSLLLIVGLQLILAFVAVESQATELTETTAVAEATSTKASVIETTVTTATTAEDKIPLKIINAEKNDDKSSSGQKAILTLGILLTLAGVGYYSVKRFSFANKPGKSNMQIKILTQHYLGPKKSIAIIRVAGESILIGVTEQNISMIKSLALLDDELPQVLPKDFSETMSEEVADQDIDTDDFSFEGIKSSVSLKIKSMRNI